MMDDMERIATALHNLKCAYNHTDGCDWYYQKDWEDTKFKSWSRTQYLMKAETLYANVPYRPPTIYTVLEAAIDA